MRQDEDGRSTWHVQHPVGAAIASSVAGGLFLAAILALVGRVKRLPLSTVLIAIAVALLAAAFLGCVAMLVALNRRVATGATASLRPSSVPRRLGEIERRLHLVETTSDMWWLFILISIAEETGWMVRPGARAVEFSHPEKDPFRISLPVAAKDQDRLWNEAAERVMPPRTQIPDLSTMRREP